MIAKFDAAGIRTSTRRENMPIALTAGLGRFIAKLRYEDIPAEAREVIAIGFTDCAGVMIAGSKEEGVSILTSTLSPARGESTLVFGAGSAPALEAAFINAVAAHALDY